MPSCEATANFDPFVEKAAEKAAARAERLICVRVVEWGGILRVPIGLKDMREPPERWCRYTSDESPILSRVRPSGEIEATSKTVKKCQWRDIGYRRTVVDGHV